jgi:hypothetical protein
MNPTQNHCPGVGEYGHGLTARVVHLGCCTGGPAIEIASRRFDGKPETEADRRLFDLRESGYTGWIDQDGHAVDGPTFVRTAAAAELVTPATTLRAAALYLDRHGWIQGSYYDPAATVFTPAACTVGAIGMVCYGGPVDAPAQHFDDPGWDDFETAVAYVDRYLIVEHDLDVYSFNDAKGRTADQVRAVLRAAADEWDRTQGGGE